MLGRTPSNMPYCLRITFAKSDSLQKPITPHVNPLRRLAFWSLPALFITTASAEPPAAGSLLPGGSSKWQLTWSDEFDYENARLDEKWISQNSSSTHILCSRWRENASTSDGTLKLLNKKEKRGTNDWTSGNLWTKEKFLHGYFECRYRYAAAEGTNNSFWIMTNNPPPEGKKTFEIDINEGHFPNEVNTNIHNHSDVTTVNGKKTHPSASKSFSFGVRPDVRIQLEIPVKTRRLRLSSTQAGHVHLGELRAYNVNPAGYPEVLSAKADTDKPGLINFAKEAKFKSSGVVKAGDDTSSKVADGKIETRWTSQKDGEKWIELEFPEEKTLGCVQFVNGYLSGGTWRNLLDDYKVSWHDGSKWVEMASFDVKQGSYNFAKDFQTYGLEWTEKELVFYFNGKELRREKNTICNHPAPIWLSLAIIPWAGQVTDSINGTFMEVDYVRVYQRK